MTRCVLAFFTLLSFASVHGGVVNEYIRGIKTIHQPAEACQKCRAEKRRQAEENRAKKREYLDKQKQENQGETN